MCLGVTSLANSQSDASGNGEVRIRAHRSNFSDLFTISLSNGSHVYPLAGPLDDRNGLVRAAIHRGTHDDSLPDDLEDVVDSLDGVCMMRSGGSFCAGPERDLSARPP